MGLKQAYLKAAVNFHYNNFECLNFKEILQIQKSLQTDQSAFETNLLGKVLEILDQNINHQLPISRKAMATAKCKRFLNRLARIPQNKSKFQKDQNQIEATLSNQSRQVNQYFQAISNGQVLNQCIRQQSPVETLELSYQQFGMLRVIPVYICALLNQGGGQIIIKQQYQLDKITDVKDIIAESLNLVQSTNSKSVLPEARVSLTQQYSQNSIITKLVLNRTEKQSTYFVEQANIKKVYVKIGEKICYLINNSIYDYMLIKKRNNGLLDENFAMQRAMLQKLQIQDFKTEIELQFSYRYTSLIVSRSSKKQTIVFKGLSKQFSQNKLNFKLTQIPNIQLNPSNFIYVLSHHEKLQIFLNKMHDEGRMKGGTFFLSTTKYLQIDKPIEQHCLRFQAYFQKKYLKKPNKMYYRTSKSNKDENLIYSFENIQESIDSYTKLAYLNLKPIFIKESHIF